MGVTGVLWLNLTILTLQHIVNHPGFYFLHVEGVLVYLRGMLRFRLKAADNRGAMFSFPHVSEGGSVHECRGDRGVV